MGSTFPWCLCTLYAAGQWETNHILARFNRESHQQREARAASNIPSPEIWSRPNWSFITNPKVDLPRQPSPDDRDQLDWYVSLPSPLASERRLTPRLRALPQVKPLSNNVRRSSILGRSLPVLALVGARASGLLLLLRCRRPRSRHPRYRPSSPKTLRRRGRAAHPAHIPWCVISRARDDLKTSPRREEAGGGV